MNRDQKLFPDDDTGDALWEMQQGSDDLSKQREIEFTVIFTNEDDAIKFGETLLRNRQKNLFADSKENDKYSSEIVVFVFMEASHEEIIGYQELLESHATPYDGLSDGWGCL